MARGWPLSLMRCLARVIRRVMVASGTRNARAISAVVSPLTARRVSAIWDAGESAGAQHMKSRISVSSESDGGRSAAGASHRSGSVQRFFFQAEDGIRDLTVTGVQTCALPI